MSLARQFGIGLFVILVIIFGGSLWINVNNTRSFIAEQLNSHAQDTATSLGLSILPYFNDPPDLAMIDTMVNAIFDRGYYLNVTLYNSEQQVLLEKKNPARANSVPSWFTDLFPISTPVAETELTEGWKIAGRLTVRSHPGIGYAQLWKSAKQTLWLTSWIFGFGLILVYILSKIVLTPLKAVVLTSQNIASRDYSLILDIPKTKELKILVHAINKMAVVLDKQFHELTALTNSYYNSAFVDQLTTLDNKQALDNTLARIFADKEELNHGYLIIVRLSSLKHVNESQGSDAADTYVKLISTQLTKLSQNNECKIFRSRGADFALITGQMTEDTCSALLSNLASTINAQSHPMFVDGCIHIGAAGFAGYEDKKSLFEHADAALINARHLPQRWKLAHKTIQLKNHKAWREELDRIFRDKDITVLIQPIKDITDQTVFSECLARFKEITGEKFLPMSQLIPESEKLFRAVELDNLIIEKIQTFVKNERIASHNLRLAVNISSATVADSKHLDDILKKLHYIRHRVDELIVEVREDSLKNSDKSCIQFAQKLREANIKLTIERYGSNVTTLTLLQKLRPDFVKIDGRFTRNIETSEDNQFFVRSLVNIAHGLQIQVIAELVESREEADCLRTLFVDYFQGYYLGKPQQW